MKKTKGKKTTQKVTHAPETIREKEQRELFEMFMSYLQSHEEDIESGIEEGLYKRSENTETLAAIEKTRDRITAFLKERPSVYMYVEGGNIQGYSVSQAMNIEVYDADNLSNDPEYEVKNGSPADWDKKITALTKANQIRPLL